MDDVTPMRLSPSPLPLPSGIGYRAPHRDALYRRRPAVGFLEVNAENYMDEGPRLAELERLRADWHLSLHGVGLSLGSVERPDHAHLQRLAMLVKITEPMLVSEHLSFSRVGEEYLNDLLPFPLTPLGLREVCRNVDIVQQRLGRRILVENPSSYLRWRRSTIAEPEFLNQLARRTGCGVLLDLNNVHVSCANLGDDPWRWCAALDPAHIGEFHLAGHSLQSDQDHTLLIDDHGSTVAAPVWALFDSMVASAAMAPVLVEWDSNLPPLAVLLAEAAKADHRRAVALARRARINPAGDCHALAG